jgi:hypothetical protein
VRAACLDIGLARRPEIGYLFSADDPLYLSLHAPVARLAPDGLHLVSLLRYVGTGEHLDRHTARADLELHASRAGVPSGDERVVDRFLAPMPVAWGSPTVGAIRPRGDELARDGIHVAGDWVGDHLLADAALDSGARAGLAAANRVARIG